MLQNATPLRKSTPWPPNISDEHVSCTEPATENASLQILFKCSTPAIVFGNATKNPHILLTFEKVHNPLRLPRETTSEPKVVLTLVFLTFWLRNVLRATTACTFSTSQLPNMWCFVHFDLEICFAPQRRAIFHLSSGQLAPHPPLLRAYFSILRGHKSLEKHSVSRLSFLFAHLHLLSSDSFSSTLLFCFSFVHIVGSLTSKLPSIISSICLSAYCVLILAFMFIITINNII